MINYKIGILKILRVFQNVKKNQYLPKIMKLNKKEEGLSKEI